ncbi:hypothetical protein A2892_04485 [Candidatus Woesebacteria bacterium RIFCSPLOWO2_01_FULL_39_10b]|uniref:Uncharacterized protein n=1 Tax=Candidatus Woesebacteria bacterium RIFCSPLOWO2_01_FULL_39_10b TaxID=1802517 RepID=A0A1F8BA09_9BACT|nr:MAG: hypothetical protein A2892_04485 [Candidatus Woesebacteria bacterium RIFCSPLOWO2_01_FULL_39_10b]
MNGDSKKVKFEDLDLFSLLRLEHLSPEKKAERIAEIQAIVMNNFFLDDLAKLLSEEDMKKFDNLAKDPAKSGELEEFLRSKVPELDRIIFEKMLTAKREIVRQNIKTRLDINEKESGDRDVQTNKQRMDALAQEKEKLEKILSSIETDDWETASNLIVTL